MAGLSLIEVLAAVPDPWSRHGRVHPLPAILALTVLAMLRGPMAIAQFGRDRGTPLAHGIENKLHYVRDGTLGEDGCRVREGSAPQVLAAVRNAVIHLLAGVEADSRAAALRRLNNHPEESLALLDLPQLETANSPAVENSSLGGG
jgi:hypothetical protein